MKYFANTLILFTALVIQHSVLLGQSKSISDENYYSVLREAESKTEKQIRKRIQIQKLFTNGEITETLTDTSEYLPPNKSRWVHVEESGNIVKKIEQITIGNLTYQKEDNGAWRKLRKEDDGFSISGKDNSTREIFIEEETIGTEKFQVLLQKTVNYNKTYFDERKTWINKKVLILKEAMTTGFMDLKNIVSSVDIANSFASKRLKITAPIK